MLTKIRSRQAFLGLSLRNLAKQLEVSPTLLSLVLSEKREPSKAMSRRLSKWLRTPIATEQAYCPSALVDQFINDRSSHLAASTLEFYRFKLRPFAVWCEKKQIVDVREVGRANVSEYLAHVRKRRISRSCGLAGTPDRLFATKGSAKSFAVLSHNFDVVKIIICLFKSPYFQRVELK